MQGTGPAPVPAPKTQASRRWHSFMPTCSCSDGQSREAPSAGRTSPLVLKNGPGLWETHRTREAGLPHGRLFQVRRGFTSLLSRLVTTSVSHWRARDGGSALPNVLQPLGAAWASAPSSLSLSCVGCRGGSQRQATGREIAQRFSKLLPFVSR